MKKQGKAEGLRARLRKGLALLAVLAVFAPFSRADDPPAAAATSAPSFQMRSFNLNTYSSDYDSQWEGIRIASDGNCYFFASSHTPRSGAGFFKYDPAKNELTCLAKDISVLCGEKPPGDVPQGKVHCDLIEMDGWLYFATHNANYRAAAEAAYTGSHLFGLELATGKIRHYGLLKARYTNYAGLGADPKRHKLFVTVNPYNSELIRQGAGTHLLEVDPATGAIRDLGLVAPGQAGGTYYLYVDADGNCWFTVRNGNGTLYCYRRKTDRIEEHADVTPGLRRWSKDKEDELCDLDMQLQRQWLWHQPLEGGKRCVFKQHNESLKCPDGRLWVYDPSWGPRHEKAFKCVAKTGPTLSFGMALGGDKVYYSQPVNMKLSTYNDELHLRSASLADGVISDYGRIFDQDGRPPCYVQAMAADTNGLICLVGRFVLKEGEEGATEYEEKDGQGRYIKGAFYKKNYGLFFAVGRVPQQAGESIASDLVK